MTRNYDLDPHVFLGRVATGESMALSACNESGCLWREHWEMHDGDYGFWMWGPCGSAWKPLSYEDAYSQVQKTMRLLQKMRARGDTL